MADYIYLLENRLSPAQQRALSSIRNIVRSRELTLFLTGGAVRDLTGGGSVRDLDFTVQGAVAPLRAELEAAGAIFDGENPEAQALFFTLPGGVRVEISSAMSVTYPKAGKPQYAPSSILDDLRRRDFTANAMGLSLNVGSYGLLMDPLNGVADIENRLLRLVSNYGFVEDPSLMLRAVRLSARLGLQMDERTRQRFDNAKADDAVGNLNKFNAAYELEEIFHEEDPLRIMRALDGEGLLKAVGPKLIGLKSNDAALAELRDKQGQLQTQGILADASALAFPLILGKLPQPEVDALKASFARPGFAAQMGALEERTREFQTRFAAKDAGTPSAAWRMLHEAEPNLVLSLFFSSKSGTVQARIKTFLTESPTARQRLPYALMQEMRIVPDLPVYAELLDKLFFELMDGKLGTPEEMKAYLEPYSPPAPPAPISLRRARAKKEARPSRAKAKKAAATVVAEEEAVAVAEGLMEPGTLTGPDRGTEPTPVEALEGKVAPLAADAMEPPPVKEKKALRKANTPTATETPAAEEGAPAAKKLTAKPAPMPKNDADDLVPHPEATKEIASKKSAVIPQAAEAPVKSGSAATAALTAVQGKAAKTTTGKPAATTKPNAVKEAAPAKKAGADSVAAKETAAKAAKTKPVEAKKQAAAATKIASKAVKTTPSKTATGKSAASGKKAAPPAKKSVTVPKKASAKKTAIKTLAKKAPAKKTPAKVSTKAPAKTAASKASGKSKPVKKSGRR